MSWIKKHLELVILILILLLTLGLRFYMLPDYMTFLGDEGRDSIVVKRILVDHRLPLLGPVTSVGNIYLGPLYYYLMAVSMAIVWLNPVAAAGMVALVGSLTVLLVYYLSREWFGRSAAILSSLLYSFSPVNIIYSRSSWNPNPAPFFALLAILGLFMARKRKDYRWFILTGAAVAFAVQMHYLALIFVLVICLLWLFDLKKGIRSDFGDKKYFVVGSLLSLSAFLVLMSPLFIFDVRHDFMNLRAIWHIFTAQDAAVSFNLLESLKRIWVIYSYSLVSRYISGPNLLTTLTVSVLILAPLLFGKLYKFRWSLLVLYIWLGVGILGLSFYKQDIYDHYLGFLNPAPFILLGSIFGLIVSLKNNVLKYAAGTLFLGLMVLILTNFIQKNPLKNPPNNQLARTQNVANYVISKSGGKPFNFALIAKRNYDSAYQFYLDLYGHKSKVVPLEITDQLFVVCEDSICNPINHPKYEIAGFGWAKIESEQQIYGVKVFKLIHNPSGN